MDDVVNSIVFASIIIIYLLAGLSLFQMKMPIDDYRSPYKTPLGNLLTRLFLHYPKIFYLIICWLIVVTVFVIFVGAVLVGLFYLLAASGAFE